MLQLMQESHEHLFRSSTEEAAGLPCASDFRSDALWRAPDHSELHRFSV